MKRRLLIWLALAMLAGAAPAQAPQPVLVPDVSDRTVEIKYSFSGAQLLLFGAILYPGGRVPTERTDIVVVLRGPSQPIIVREKQKIAGVWVNAESAEFRSAPSFYAIASSRPLRDIVDERTAAIYELGLAKLQLSPSSLNDDKAIDRFAAGLTELRQRSGLFVERQGTVRIADGVLYRANLPLSARVIVGTYTAETFLIRNGRVVAAAVREITVKKSGFERLIEQFADRQPLIYGFTAIIMALGLGLLAGFIARRA